MMLNYVIHTRVVAALESNRVVQLLGAQHLAQHFCSIRKQLTLSCVRLWKLVPLLCSSSIRFWLNASESTSERFAGERNSSAMRKFALQSRKAEHCTVPHFEYANFLVLFAHQPIRKQINAQMRTLAPQVLIEDMILMKGSKRTYFGLPVVHSVRHEYRAP